MSSMHLKLDVKVLCLVLVLLSQVLLVVFYMTLSSSWKLHGSEKLPKPIRFVSYDKGINHLDRFKDYYHSEVDDEIFLKDEKVEEYFTTLNDTICFQPGTDVGYMQRSIADGSFSHKCECLPGYHGNDCSIPEIIWRAFIALQHNTIITKRQNYSRKIIYMFHMSHPSEIQQAVITINELLHVVDLFVVSESNYTDNGQTKEYYFQRKLDKGLFSAHQFKILYVPVRQHSDKQKTKNQLMFDNVHRVIKNVQLDDLVIMLDNYQIPNPKSLMFFKLYDGFALPISFRMRWNVYGYFYQHPLHTDVRVGGFTYEMLTHNMSDHILSGFVIGDLNHVGGWLCELCVNPNDLLNAIQSTDRYDHVINNSHQLDVTRIEDLISDGIYVDGKTKLVKVRESDINFGPAFVLNNTWKYDSLIVNYYSKIDYN